MKNRLVRVRELLQRELGAIIARDHAFPGVLVTVNDVDITPDLKHAYVYIGIIGPGQKAERVVESLNHQHGELQSRVAKRVILKNTPRFHFRLDHSVERGVRVTQIMETIDRQLADSVLHDEEPPDDAVHGEQPREHEEEIHGAEDVAEEDEERKPAAPAFPRRTGPRRSPRHFAQRDDD